MNSGLYSSNVTCPVCGKDFRVLKVKSTAYKLNHVDEDFCMYYDDLNPLFYDPFVCEHCGFTEIGALVDRLPEGEKRKLQKFCLNKFIDDPKKNPFELTDFHKQVYAFMDALSKEGERDIESALMAYKILQTNLEVREAVYSFRAKNALRIAWLYRFIKDPTEDEYLSLAAAYFVKAYETEELEEGKFDAATCAYLIGEMYRRTHNPVVSLEWFGRALVASQNSRVPKINDKIRDQIQVVKMSQEYKDAK